MLCKVTLCAGYGFQPIVPGLISCVWVTIRCGLLVHAQNRVRWLAGLIHVTDI